MQAKAQLNGSNSFSSRKPGLKRCQARTNGRETRLVNPSKPFLLTKSSDPKQKPASTVISLPTSHLAGDFLLF